MPIEAYYLCGDVQDQQKPNRCEPNVPVTLEYLKDLGIIHYALNPETMLTPSKEYEGLCKVDHLAKELGFPFRDEVRISPELLPDYDNKVKIFFKEHLHEDNEIRLIVAGSGYFDIRSHEDKWIRVQVGSGDLIIVPAGIYHRFTTDEGNFTHAIRMFQENPQWAALNRPSDDNPRRKAYVEKYLTNFPPVRETVLGPLTTPTPAPNFNVMYVHQPETDFEPALKQAMANCRRGHKDFALFYFTGSVVPLTGKSWCPDCVEASATVKKLLQEQKPNDDQHITFVQCPIERTMHFLGNLYKTHPFSLVESVPTFIAFTLDSDGTVKKTPNITDSSTLEKTLKSIW